MRERAKSFTRKSQAEIVNHQSAIAVTFLAGVE
jgi:hypothetical protein